MTLSPAKVPPSLPETCVTDFLTEWWKVERIYLSNSVKTVDAVRLSNRLEIIVFGFQVPHNGNARRANGQIYCTFNMKQNGGFSYKYSIDARDFTVHLWAGWKQNFRCVSIPYTNYEFY